MISIDSTSNKSTRRRSSIFKSSYAKNLSQPVTDEANLQKCKESLEHEKDEWRNSLQKLKDEYEKLKSKLVRQEDNIANTDLDVEELEFFDQTFYQDYLRTIQNICTKFECLIEEKEQQDIIIEKRRKVISNLIKKYS